MQNQTVKQKEPSLIGHNLPKSYYQDDKYGITIYHGDCRDILPDLEPVDLVLTDPPYGCGVSYGLSYDDSPDGYWEWFLPTIDLMRRAGKVLAFTHKDIGHISSHDWVVIWDKGCNFGPRIGNSPVIAGGWEPIYLFGIHSIGVKGPGLPSIIRFKPEGNNIHSKMGREKWQFGPNLIAHPAPKPISLYKSLIPPLNPNCGTILDPFMGSGTTLVAAKDLGRKAIGIEIEEKYCEIAVRRLQQDVFQWS